MSLALYSKPYRETKGEKVNTTQGEMINLYKYHEELTPEQREKIAQTFAAQVFNLIRTELKRDYPNPTKPPFDVVLGLPENRNTGRSLPKDLCRILAEEHLWLSDGFSTVTKTRPGTVLKEIPASQRREKVLGLYAIKKGASLSPKRGFLIIDDVFETGSTVSGLCDTLQKEFPKVPRFVVALTHLHATERLAQ